MAEPPRVPAKRRKTDAFAERVVGWPLFVKIVDPHQPGLFDAPLPGWLKPCLPTLVDAPPTGSQWSHEIKWDGYRVSAYVEAGAAIIRTCSGHNWTNRFPAMATALAQLPVRSAVIDGEAVILDEKGRSSFAELQADLDKHGSTSAVLYAFDLLFLDGEVLWTRPLLERRAALAGMLPPKSSVLFSEDFRGSGADLLRIASEHGLEGIVSKRLDKPYRSGKRRDWLKTKCVQSVCHRRLPAGLRLAARADCQP